MSDDLKALESLTDTTIDSAKGYETAAGVAKTAKLRATLQDQATKRCALVDILNGEIIRLGGTARMDGSAFGAAHRAWTSFTDAFSSGDKEASERVEEGEDDLEEKYREALDTGNFDTRTRQILIGVYGQIADGKRLTDRLKEQYD